MRLRFFLHDVAFVLGVHSSLVYHVFGCWLQYPCLSQGAVVQFCPVAHAFRCWLCEQDCSSKTFGRYSSSVFSAMQTCVKDLSPHPDISKVMPITRTAMSHTFVNDELDEPILSIPYLRTVLQIDESASNCHGQTAKNTPCRTKLSKESQASIIIVLTHISQTYNGKGLIASYLKELSELIHCKRNHQKQAPARATEWRLTLATLKMECKANLCTASKDKHDSMHSDSRKISADRRAVRMNPATSKETVNNIGLTPQVRLRSPRDPEPVACRTRARTSHPNKPSELPQPSTFLPYYPPTHTINTHFVSRLRKPLTTSERAPGKVYIFSRPDTPDLFKIGFTKNIPRQRLSDIGRQCQYIPQLRFFIECKHARRLENLVHAYFYTERRKEMSHNGKCNNGKGCERVHQEWFGVDLNHATNIMKMLAAWIDLQEPYVDDALDRDWKERVDNFCVCERQAHDSWERLFQPDSIVRKDDVAAARSRQPISDVTNITYIAKSTSDIVPPLDSKTLSQKQKLVTRAMPQSSAGAAITNVFQENAERSIGVRSPRVRTVRPITYPLSDTTPDSKKLGVSC